VRPAETLLPLEVGSLDLEGRTEAVDDNGLWHGRTNQELRQLPEPAAPGTSFPPGALVTARRPQPAFFTVEEVADLLRVDSVTIYRAIRSGEFPAVKVRKRYVVPQRAIELLVDDVVATGSCVDTAAWTSSWRQSVGAPVEVPSWAR
jgi:excisionase family DNA binding protein